MSLDWLNPVKWFDSISNTVFGGLNYAEQKKVNQQNYELAKLNSERNYKLQVDTLNYQKELQQKVFDREDTAVQRKKADLIAAGMNPLLAAGSGAGAGSVVPVITPQYETPQQQATLFQDGIGQGISKTIDEMIRNKKIGAEIDEIQARESLLQSNKAKIDEETKNVKQMFFNLKLDFDNKKLDNMIKSVGYDIELERLKGATIGNEINQLSLEQKTALQQYALDFGMPANLITPEMGFAALIAQRVGDATSDIFNAVEPIFQQLPIVGAIWNSIGSNEKVQALNSILGVFGAILGVNFAKLKINSKGKVIKDGDTYTITHTKQLPNGEIIKEQIKQNKKNN